MNKIELLYLENINKFTHALLIKTNYCCDLNSFLKEYFKKILFLSDSTQELTSYFNKIDNDNYLDLIVLDANVQTIKKEDIVNIHNQFVKPAIERAGFKFCVIKNFQRVNDSAFNTLLKTLEEPTSNTYFVLTTDSYDNVPKTILSRCQRFNLTTDNNKLNHLIEKHPDIKLISHAFIDLEELINFINSNDYIFFNKLINKFQTHKWEDYKKIADEFKKLDYKQIYFFINLISTLSTPNFQKNCLQLLYDLNLNPSKTLIFFKLWQTWGN